MASHPPVQLKAATSIQRNPLYGHTSADNAAVCNDYPYGFKERTRIRYYLEHNEKKGFRFVSQTENPKTLRWNAPKKSTYMLIAGCMYSDENNHIHWSGVSEYTSAKDALAFVNDFPLADLRTLTVWAMKKIVFLNALINGKAYFTMIGEKQEATEADKVRNTEERDEWQNVINALRVIREKADGRVCARAEVSE